MLNSANGGAADTAVAGARAEALMAEVVALRAILLNVMFKQSNGERLTAEEIQRLVERADSDKLRRARERHLQAQVGKVTERKILIVFVVSGSVKRVGAVGDEPSVGSW